MRRFFMRDISHVDAMTALAATAISLAWLVPNHYPPWSSFHNESVMAVGLLVAAWTFVRQKVSRLPVVSAVVSIGATIPWLQLGTGQLDFSGDAGVASLYLLSLATAVYVGFSASAGGASRFAASLAIATLAAALVSCALAAAQCLGIPGGIWIAEIPFGSRGIGNLAQPNNLATLIGLGTVGLWVLFEQGRVRVGPSIMALGVLLVGATLTQSRTVLLFGPALLLMRVAIQLPKSPWRVSLRTLIAAIVAEWLLTLAWPHAREALGLSAPDSLAKIDLQSGRWKVWPVLIDGVLQKPWFGYGWLQTGAAQLAVAERHPPFEELFLQAHNLFLDLVIWCGLPLGLLLGALPVGWFASRLRRVTGRDAALGLMGIGLFGIHAMLELPHHYLYFLVPVGLWAGLIEADCGAKGVGPRWAALALTICTTALALAVAWDYPAVEEDFRLVRFETLSIGSLRATQPAPDAPFLSSLTAYLRFVRLPLKSDMQPEALAGMDAVTRRYPYAPMLYRYAKALALNGRLPESLLLLDKLRHIHGEPRYQALRGVLHQEVVDGKTELAALDAAAPR